MEVLKNHLGSHRHNIWEYLVDKVIDVFAGHYEADPGDKLPNDEFHIDFPHILKYGPQAPP